MGVKVANNATSTIVGAISSSDVGITVAAGTGALFPVLGAGDYFYATLVSTGGTREIVKVTARASDAMTIVRGQEGTTAQSFAVGSRLELRITAASITDMIDEHDQASEIAFTPTGGIAATNVQSAIAELNSDLAGVSSSLAATGGSALVGFIQAGAGATARTAQAKMRDFVSPVDFGAVGDGTTDDRAAFLLALQSGRPVDGNGKTYAISGTMQPSSFVGLRNANFVQLSPTTASVATLYIYALSDWFIENCKFNMGSTQNTGSNDDSSRSALRVRHADGSYCQNFRISGVEVYGDGNGSRIQVRQSKRFVIEGCLVRDGTASFSPDPTNDIMNGYDLSDCANFTLANCSVYNLRCVLSGSPANRYTRGFLFTEVRDCAIVGCNATTTDQNYDFSGAVFAGITPSYYEGNRRFTLSGCTANNAGTWGFKFANVTHDGLITGCIANNSGSGGFVVSAPNSATTVEAYATSNLDFVGCKAVNVLGTGAAGAGNAVGFRTGRASVGVANFDTYPRGVRFKSCEVIDNQTVPTTNVGFLDDVNLIRFNSSPNTGYNKNIANTATGCHVGPGVTTPFNGIGPTLCVVTGTGTQTTSNGVWTVPLWDANRIDNQGMHSTVSNTDKIYIREPGTYEVFALATFAASAVGGRLVRLAKNGAVIDRTASAVSVCGAGFVQSVQTSALDNAVTGDYYSIEVYQNAGGGSLNFLTNESAFRVRKVD